MPPKKSSKSPIKSPIKVKSKKGFKDHTGIKRQSNKQIVILQGIQCNRNIYLAWLEYSGTREGEGYYVKPIDDAWNSTVMNNAGGHPSPLYPLPPHKSNESIIDIFQIDYWTDRRAERGIEKAKESIPGKGFPFKTFVWTRPPIEDNAEKGIWELDKWLTHLKDELLRFMAWTRKNDTTYAPFKFAVRLQTRTRKTITPLADEILDSSIIVVIRNMFEIKEIDDILNDTEADDSIRMVFFGPNVSIEEFQYRMKNAWHDLLGSDEEE